MKSVGEVGEIEAESEVFLVGNGVESCDFPQEALDCLPKDLPWKIPKASSVCSVHVHTLYA